MTGYFITGTDTGVGKTIVCGLLAHHLKARYWKPIQTGPRAHHDALTIAEIIDEKSILPSTYQFLAPLSPHEAARLEQKIINFSSLILSPPKLSSQKPLIVEGAGGVLVPLNKSDLMIDLIRQISLPVIVVARTTLGTINHTLLTLAALRARDIPIAGVMMNGMENTPNADAIAFYGQVPIVGWIPWAHPFDWQQVIKQAEINWALIKQGLHDAPAT